MPNLTRISEQFTLKPGRQGEKLILLLKIKMASESKMTARLSHSKKKIIFFTQLEEKNNDWKLGSVFSVVQNMKQNII